MKCGQPTPRARQQLVCVFAFKCPASHAPSLSLVHSLSYRLLGAAGGGEEGAGGAGGGRGVHRGRVRFAGERAKRANQTRAGRGGEGCELKESEKGEEGGNESADKTRKPRVRSFFSSSDQESRALWSEFSTRRDAPGIPLHAHRAAGARGGTRDKQIRSGGQEEKSFFFFLSFSPLLFSCSTAPAPCRRESRSRPA